MTVAVGVGPVVAAGDGAVADADGVGDWSAMAVAVGVGPVAAAGDGVALTPGCGEAGGVGERDGVWSGAVGMSAVSPLGADDGFGVGVGLGGLGVGVNLAGGVGLGGLGEGVGLAVGVGLGVDVGFGSGAAPPPSSLPGSLPAGGRRAGLPGPPVTKRDGRRGDVISDSSSAEVSEGEEPSRKKTPTKVAPSNTNRSNTPMMGADRLYMCQTPHRWQTALPVRNRSYDV